jgi:hypothetical protein
MVIFPTPANSCAWTLVDVDTLTETFVPGIICTIRADSPISQDTTRLFCRLGVQMLE